MTDKKFEPVPPSKQYTQAPQAPTDNELDSKHRRLVKMQTNFELPPGQEPLPLKNDDHAVNLLNISYQTHRPSSMFPAFRLLGSFPDVDTMKAHIKNYYDPSDCSLWYTFSHQLMPICLTHERQQDKAYCEARVADLIELYTKSHESSQQDFENNVEEGKTGTTGESLFAKERKRTEHINEEKKQDAPEHMRALPKVAPLSAASALMGQKFAVVIMLRDLRQEVIDLTFQPEPVIMVLEVFDNYEKAIFYAKHTGSKAYPICALDVIEMYNWIFPEHIDTDKLSEVYGNTELDHIMTGRKDANANSAKYIAYCKANNIQHNVVDV